MRISATHARVAAACGRPAFKRTTPWAGGEKGFLLDFADWRTLFQDVNGETPITAAGQPVALALDCKNGVPIRRNLFTNSNTVIPTANTTADYNALQVQYGDRMLSLDYLRDTATNSEHYGERMLSVVAGTVITGNYYTFSFVAKGDGSGKLAYIRTALRGTAGMRFDFTTGVASTISGDGTNGAIYYGNGVWRLWLKFLATSTGMAVFRPQILSASGQAIHIGSGTGYYVGGHQLDTGDLTELQDIGVSWAATCLGNHAVQATSTSRFVTALDASGVPSVVSDGVDDFMQISGIDLTTTNKLTLLAAVRKSNANAGSIFGQTNSLSYEGFWELGQRIYANNDLALTVAGTASNSAQNYLSFAPGATQIISAQINGSGVTMADYFKMRANGVAAAPGASSAGPYSAARFKNEPITIGSRGSGSNRFGGNIYQLGLRDGLTDDVLLAKMEKSINAAVGAY